MATITHAGSTWNTNANSQQVVATPAVDDLIVIVHGASGWASGETGTVGDDQGGSYDIVGGDPLSSAGGTGGALWISIRTALIASAVSFTWTVNNQAATGGGLTVFRVSGMSRVGSGAVKQVVGESTQTENPPSIAFGAATLTENPIILAVLGEDNPAGVTPPTGFTEAHDGGWATPTTGIEVCFVNSGQTSSSYAWSGGALTDHNEVGIELDTSAAATGHPTMRRWGGTPHLGGYAAPHNRIRGKVRGGGSWARRSSGIWVPNHLRKAA